MSDEDRSLAGWADVIERSALQARTVRHQQGAMKTFVVTTGAGERHWQAEDAGHAREQHEDAFPDEQVLSVREYAAEQESKSPHERAMDRREAARAALAETVRQAEEMVRAAEREAAEAYADLVRYEKSPGVPLPVEDQLRVQALSERARRFMAERRAGQEG